MHFVELSVWVSNGNRMLMASTGIDYGYNCKKDSFRYPVDIHDIPRYSH